MKVYEGGTMKHTVHTLKRLSNHLLLRLANVTDEGRHFFPVRMACPLHYNPGAAAADDFRF